MKTTVVQPAAVRGDTVTVTLRPDEGYEVDEITVTDRNGKPVEVTQKPDGTCTFIQPTGKVKIEVSYKEVNTPWNNPFADADEISPFAMEAMRWAMENGILNGYGGGRLGPQGQATRAQVAQMLKNYIENQEENT